jgi:putative membrane protein (TIGR04086 family)
VLFRSISIFSISTSAVPIINQVIKSLCILISALITFKLPKNGWIRGILFGILYSFLTFFVFSLLYGEFSFGLSLLNDIALGGVTGLISGIIAVNLRKSR